MRPVIQRCFIGQRAIRDLRHHHAVILHAKHARIGDHADRHRIQPPLVEHAENFVFPALFRHQQHPLLRFGQHHFIRSHARLALRNVLHIELHARARAAAHLAARTGKSRRTHVLNAHNRACLHRLQTSFQQQLFKEWIAHLHIRPLLFRFLGKLSRRHGCPMNPIAAGLSAHVNHRIPYAHGLTVENLALAEHT